MEELALFSVMDQKGDSEINLDHPGIRAESKSWMVIIPQHMHQNLVNWHNALHVVLDEFLAS